RLRARCTRRARARTARRRRVGGSQAARATRVRARVDVGFQSGLAVDVDVVATVVACGAERHELEVCRERALDVAGRVIGATEARSRRPLVEDDEVSLRELALFGFVQATQ